MLPGRWWVLGYTGGQLMVTGAGARFPINSPSVPTRRRSPTIPATNAVPVDEGMKLDDRLRRRGGARRHGHPLRLAPEQAQGFDFLLVFGTKAVGQLSRISTAELVALLGAHHYTNGLGFTLQGTPTNNTEDDPAGFDTADRDGERSYQDERRGLGIRSRATVERRRC